MANKYLKTSLVSVCLSIFSSHAFSHGYTASGNMNGTPPSSDAGSSEQGESPVGVASTIINKANLWPVSKNQSVAPHELTACFKGGEANTRGFVVNTVAQWDKLASGLNINFGTETKWNECESIPAEIRISFDSSGDWSYVGRQALRVKATKATINLESATGPLTPSRAPDMRGTILHEFGHALALDHEHQSKEANCEEELNWPKVYADLALQNWTKEKVDFNIRPLLGYNLYTEYQKDSIMHYGWPESWFNNPIEATCLVGVPTELAETDKRAIQQMYPRTRKAQNDYLKNLATRMTKLISTQPKLSTDAKLALQTSFNKALPKEYLENQGGINIVDSSTTTTTTILMNASNGSVAATGTGGSTITISGVTTNISNGSNLAPVAKCPELSELFKIIDNKTGRNSFCEKVFLEKNNLNDLGSFIATEANQSGLDRECKDTLSDGLLTKFGGFKVFMRFDQEKDGAKNNCMGS